MFRERLKNMSAEEREIRFRNIGDPRRRDRFVSTYELGVRSPFVLYGIAAFNRSFKLLEQTLADMLAYWRGLVADNPLDEKDTHGNRDKGREP